MQQFSFYEFLTYYREKYIGNIDHSLSQGYSGIVNCILSNRDPWFHIFSCELYTLHLLGIEIECIDNEYIIYRNDSNNTDLSIGDKIQQINGHSVDTINAISQNCTSITLDCITKCSEQKTSKRTKEQEKKYEKAVIQRNVEKLAN